MFLSSKVFFVDFNDFEFKLLLQHFHQDDLKCIEKQTIIAKNCFLSAIMLFFLKKLSIEQHKYSTVIRHNTQTDSQENKTIEIMLWCCLPVALFSNLFLQVSISQLLVSICILIFLMYQTLLEPPVTSQKNLQFCFKSCSDLSLTE